LPPSSQASFPGLKSRELAILLEPLSLPEDVSFSVDTDPVNLPSNALAVEPPMA